MEKPAAWVGDDTPSLVAALMAQRPPYMRPRKDALLQAERLSLRGAARGEEREREKMILRRQLERSYDLGERDLAADGAGACCSA